MRRVVLRLPRYSEVHTLVLRGLDLLLLVRNISDWQVLVLALDIGNRVRLNAGIFSRSLLVDLAALVVGQERRAQFTVKSLLGVLSNLNLV